MVVGIKFNNIYGGDRSIDPHSKYAQEVGRLHINFSNTLYHIAG